MYLTSRTAAIEANCRGRASRSRRRTDEGKLKESLFKKKSIKSNLSQPI